MRDTKKVVEFRSNAGISQELIEELTEHGHEYGLDAIMPFSTDRITVKTWVHLKCRYGCKQFGTNWCCPPATPEPREVEAILAEYKTALLLVGKTQCPDFYRNNAKKRNSQVKFWKGTVSIERLLFLKGYYKAFSLVGETCALCKECAYPKPCRFPQEKRPSIESFAIDVIGTLKNLGTTATVATSTAQTFDYYGIILLE